jgi:hypothetical protein
MIFPPGLQREQGNAAVDAQDGGVDHQLQPVT